MMLIYYSWYRLPSFLNSVLFDKFSLFLRRVEKLQNYLPRNLNAIQRELRGRCFCKIYNPCPEQWKTYQFIICFEKKVNLRYEWIFEWKILTNQNNGVHMAHLLLDPIVKTTVRRLFQPLCGRKSRDFKLVSNTVSG